VLLAIYGPAVMLNAAASATRDRKRPRALFGMAAGGGGRKKTHWSKHRLSDPLAHPKQGLSLTCHAR
jgi:hypothetical protein